jgi:hypothetical protein
VIEQCQESTVIPSFEVESMVTDTPIIGKVINEASLREMDKRDKATLHQKRYFEAAVELSKRAGETINEKYPSVLIIEFRTSLLSSANGLNLLMVLDIVDIDTELNIGFILSDIEKDFSATRDIVCEIHCMRKIKYIDSTTINEQYPFVVKAQSLS